ncbi:MAG: filamentous hemagglutinin N-terminal domain-containing protein [Rhodanobacteraceae bacterium]
MYANIPSTRRTTRVPQHDRSGQTASRLRYKHLAFGVGLALGSLLVCGTASAASGVAAAQSPTGGRVVGGAGSIVQHGARTIVNQQSKLLALDWQSFNVGKDASVLFKQPGTRAIALNRILDQHPSQIFGKISSNGQIFLINTHGIIFGASAQLNVGGLVASTLDLTPDDFLKRHFDLDAHGGHAGVVNHGTIAAASGGSVSLVGGHVENDGVIVADYGHINLDGADKAVLDFDGNGLINVEITGALKKRLDDDQTAVANKGTLQATSGTVVLQASAAKDLFTNLVNNSGVIKAGGISTAGGVVQLVGNGGNVIDSGRIDVSGTRGGSVRLLSDQNVGVTGGSIDASGINGGGSIRVGGGWQGGEGLPTAQATYVAPDAALDASAIQSGNGGSVVVWGNAVNNFYGSISARGGAVGGNGGRVETSSRFGLNAQGKVDASAPNGQAGTWLLDPHDVEITGSTGSLSGTAPDVYYSASTDDSKIAASVINGALTGGTNVSIFTGSDGTTQPGDITVSDSITAAGQGSLYLMAAGSILVNADIKGQGTGNPLNVYLWANYGGAAPGGSTYAYSGNDACNTCKVVIGDSSSATIATYGGNVDIRTGEGTNTGGSVEIGSGATGVTGSIDTTDGVNPSGSISVATTGIAEDAATGNYVHAGTATFDAGAGAITLGNTDNKFTGAVVLNNSGANAVTLDNGSNALKLGASAVGSGTLTVSGKGITQSGAITQATGAGAATFNAGAGVLTLGNSGNAFTGAVSLNNSGVSAVTLDNGNNALDLGASSVGFGPLNVSGTGITQSGAITQATSAGAATFNAGAGVLTLGNSGNAFTGAVSLNNSGANAVTLDNGSNALKLGASAVGSDTLTVSGKGITQSGAITQTTGAGTATFNAGAGVLTLDNTGNDFTGAVVLNNSGVNAVTLDNGNNALKLGASSVGSDTLTVSGKGITQSGAITQATGAGTATFNAGAGVLTLDNTGNDFTGAVVLNNSGVNAVTLDNGSNALKLGASSVGSDTLTVSGKGITQSGAITQATSAGAATFNAGAGVLTLDNTGNDFTGAVVLNNSGVSAVTLDNGSNALKLGASSVGSGTLTVSGTGITQSGAITQAAGAGAATFDAGAGVLALGNTSNAFTGAVSLNNSGANAVTLDNGSNALKLGASSVGSGTLTVSGTGITQSGAVKQAAGAGATTFNAGSNDALTLANANNAITGSVTATGAGVSITTTGNLQIASLTDTMDHDLSLIAGGTLSAVGAINTSSGNITLTANGGALTTAALTGHDIALTGADGITLDDNVNASGTLGLTSTNASITQSSSGNISAQGVTTVNAGTGAITLANTGNDFTGAVGLTGGTTSITDKDALTLGALATGKLTATSTGALDLGSGKVTGNLSATSNDGAITQDTTAGKTLTITGTTGLDAGAGDITLANTGNDFTGAVGLTGSTTSITDKGALTLGALATGKLTATSTGALDLGSGKVTGNLSATSNDGAITQDTTAGKTLTITGTAGLDAGAGDITLANTGNDFTGAVDLTGGTTKVMDTNALTLGTLATGDLTVTSGGALDLGSGTVGNLQADSSAGNGAITQDTTAGKTLTITGTTGLDAGAGDIMLANTGNDFTGAVGLTGGTTKVTDTNALTLGTLATGDLTVTSTGAMGLGSGKVTGNLSVTSNDGAITQDTTAGKTLTVTGTAKLDAGTGAIALANTGNDFTGAVDLTGGTTKVMDTNALTLGTLATGDLTVTSTGALDLGSGKVTGNLSATSNDGAITQDTTAGKTLTITGTAGLDAGTGDITLANTGNDFTGAVDLTGGTTNITDKNALTLGTLATGDLTVVSTGAMGLGSGKVTGNLSVTSNDGAITQDTTAGKTLVVTGTTGLHAGAGAITLANTGNGFSGAVTAAGAGVSIATSGDLDIASLNDVSDHNLSLIAGGALTMPAGAIDTGTGVITLETGSGALSVPTLTGSNITVIANGGALTTAALTGHDIALTGSDGITLDGDVSASGTLGLTSTHSPITQSSGTITTTCATTCTTTVDAGTGTGAGAITLTGIGNDFGGAVNLAGGTTAITDAGALTLGALDTGALSVNSTGTLNLGTGTVGGALQATSNNGAITQATATGDSLTVTGSATLAAGTGKITLTDGGNDFKDLVYATGNGVLITDANDLEIASLTDNSDGDVSLIAGGALSGVGAIDAGTTGNITLAANGGALTTAALTGGDIKLTGANGITLGGSGVTASGTLTLDSGNTISQDAGAGITADTLTGHSTGATDLGGANSITTLDGFTANGFSLTDGNTLTVAASSTVDGGAGGTSLMAGALTIDGTVGNAGGTTSLTANAGNITEGTGGIVVASTLTGDSSGDTTLKGENQIGTLGHFNAGNFTLVNHAALSVTGPLITTGDISLTTTGTGNVLSVGQALTGGAITLDSAGDLGVQQGIQASTINLAANGNLAIDAAVDSGSGVTTLTQNGSGGGITEGTHGVITADTLTGTAQGSVMLDKANAVTNLGDFTASNGFKLSNGQKLTVTAGHTVDGGASTALETTGAGSDLALDGNVKGTTVDLSSSSNVTEGSHGIVTAGVLTGSVAHAVQLNGANTVASLGDFTANGLTLNNTGALAIGAGATVDGGANTALTVNGGATGNLAINGTLKGTTTTLQVAGDISEGANGVVSAGTLTGNSVGSTSLTGRNDVANLGDFSADGFALSTASALSVTDGSTIAGRSGVALTTTGAGHDLSINGTITGIVAKLVSGGAISEGANGFVQAGAFSGSSAGDTKLTHTEVTELDAFSAKNFSLTDAHALSMGGPLTTTGNAGDISLTTTGSGNALTINQAVQGAAIKLSSASDLTITNAVTGTNVALASHGNLAINAAVSSGAGTTTLTQTGSGAIMAGANGSITAATLTGSATGATTLGSDGQFMANHVGVLGGFSSPAGFSLTNDGTLTLASVGGSAYTVDAGKSKLYLEVHNGDLLQNGTNWLYDGTGTWYATGHIGLATAPIYVTGVDQQAVKFIGLPPAYFYAVDYQGNLLPLTGGSSVNVPTSVLSSRSQGINGHTDHYIDVSVITAHYRGYGVVPPGLLLPPDQWDCAPDQPSSELCPKGN